MNVYVWKKRIIKTSVGHVMMTEHNAKDVFLSEFPTTTSAGEGYSADSKKGQRAEGTDGVSRTGYEPTMEGSNVTMAYDATFYNEGYRDPDAVYMVQVRDVEAFNRVVREKRAVKIWSSDPEVSSKTQCSTAVFAALVAGGVPFKGRAEEWARNIKVHGEISCLFPGTLDDWMADLTSKSSITGVWRIPFKVPKQTKTAAIAPAR